MASLRGDSFLVEKLQSVTFYTFDGDSKLIDTRY